MALVFFLNVAICLRIYPTSCSDDVIFTLATSESDELVAKLAILKGHTTKHELCRQGLHALQEAL